MRHDGDVTKQPPECKPVFTPYGPENPKRFERDTGTGTWSRCPNLKNTYEGFDGERYDCDVCGMSYFLDYEDMK